MAPNIALEPRPSLPSGVPHRARPFLAMAAAVVAMALAAPLIRLTAAPPLAVAGWRLTIASVLLLPAFLRSPWRSEWSAVPGPDRRAAWLAGAALALHFAAWITAVRLTSVAASGVLVSLSPVFAWGISAVWLRERPAPRQAGGILLAVAGAAVIALGDASGGGGQALLGDALALIGAAFGGYYFVVGRRLRRTLSLAAYVTPVYALAAVLLLGWAATRGEAFAPYAPRDWAVFAALAVGPMLVGHTGLNYALRYLPAYVVNVAALGEPVGATLIAWTLPAIAEPPGPAAIAGGGLCLAGIVLALAGAARPASR